MARAVLAQINLVVGDMAASLAFYRRLGWTITTPGGSQHAEAELPNGLRVEFDSPDFTAVWDSGYAGATGGSTVLGLSTETREEVDEVYADLVAQGNRGRRPPYDAFWGVPLRDRRRPGRKPGRPDEPKRRVAAILAAEDAVVRGETGDETDQ
jgi:predicted lactoylglutathione lyase